jgi:hypothetical protein
VLLGFRAGADPLLGLAAGDFAGLRRAIGLDPGHAPLGRVFPAKPYVTAATPPARLIAALEQAAGPVLAAGMVPFLSFKPDVAATLAGRLDRHFAAVGRWAAALGTASYWTVWHEPENDLMGAPAGDIVGRAHNFVAVHSRAYRHIKNVAGDQALMGPTHMVYQWLPGSATTADGAVAAAWLVPADRRDFVAADAYTSDWSWKTVGDTLAAKRDFRRWMTTLEVAPGEVVLAERGITRTGPHGQVGQARVLAADYTYLKDMGAHALLYWNSTGAVDSSVFQLGRLARQAFATLASDAARLS